MRGWPLRETLLALYLLLLPRPCLADNLGLLGNAFAFLFLCFVVTIVFMILFLVRIQELRRKLRARQADAGLVRATRVLAVVWFVLAAVPLLLAIQSTTAVMILFLGGLPGHIPAGLALSRAGELARLPPPASGDPERAQQP